MFSRFNKTQFVGVAVVVGVVLLGAVFYAGYTHGQNQIPSQFLVEGVVNKTVGQPDGVDFSLFWDTWRVLEEKYVGRADLDRQEMVFGAIAGMVNALGDPHTVFLTPRETDMFREDLSGQFEGIGAEIGIRAGALVVISPLESSPAQRAGLRAGDHILAVNDASTDDMSLFEAVQNIRGERGTSVTLTIAREGESAQDITITRQRIEIPVLSWEMRDDVAHVRLFSFSEQAPRAFRDAVSEMLRQGTQKIVLDLRNNSGGFLEVSQEIAGWFVDPGEVIVIEDFGDDREQREFRAVGNGALRNFDVVVLINEGSASASEIIAGALRDIRGVSVVGVQSFGKGSIQELDSLRDGASVKVTIARWLTPNGTSISEVGITPDIVVEVDIDELEDVDDDPQLDRALEVVREL